MEYINAKEGPQAELETSYHSYPKVWALGHGAITELLYDEVVVQEKVDGSQFSFGLIDGHLRARSKGKQIVLDAPDKMFERAVETITGLRDKLKDGWTYRCEYLMKPKHNVLCYDRVPEKYLIIYDINIGHEKYLPPEFVQDEAIRLGLESVPFFFKGKIENAEMIRELLDTTSILGKESGKVKIEGIVIKNYSRFGRDGKVMMGKFVSEEFKEKHDKGWKKGGEQNIDIKQVILTQFRSEARWQKAIQHLRDNGTLENSPRDIGNLIKEIQKDCAEECIDEIKQMLWNWIRDDFKRSVIRGFPEWYKEKLMESQFEE